MKMANSTDDIPGDGLFETVARLTGETIEAYQRSPVLRMLTKLILPLSVVEAGILGTYAWFQNRRLQVFADEFISLKLGISEDDAKRKEFFDAYTSTAQHVLSESRDAKIRLFARLFGEFIRGGCITPIDRYEEHLQLLDEVSEREFKLLLLLARHEGKHPMQRSDNRLTRTNYFWAEFASDAQRELGLEEDNLESMLARLTRTGMYQEITGAYFDYTGGRGYMTSSFEEFLCALGISPDAQAAHSSALDTEPEA
jgi:hypothetical protein